MRREDINLVTMWDYRKLAVPYYKPIGDRTKDGLHCSLGLMVELLKFETGSGVRAQMEELGELGWYLAMYSHVYEINLNHVYLNTARNYWSLTDMRDFKTALCQLGSMARSEGMGKTINEDLRASVFYNALEAWEKLCWAHGLKPEVILREQLIRVHTAYDNTDDTTGSQP